MSVEIQDFCKLTKRQGEVDIIVDKINEIYAQISLNLDNQDLWQKLIELIQEANYKINIVSKDGGCGNCILPSYSLMIETNDKSKYLVGYNNSGQKVLIILPKRKLKFIRGE